MGRPLSKKFFGTTAGGGFQIGCTADVGAGNVASFVVQQKSNLKYQVAEVATPANTLVCKLQAATPAAPGQMQISVTVENAQTPAEATFEIDTNIGGEVSAIRILDGGYGYWANGQFAITDATLTGNDDAVVTYTVSNGSIVTASVVDDPGTGYTASQTDVPINTADIPDEAATAPVQYARIINRYQVKTFEGNTYVWNAVGGDGSGGRAQFTEATLQGS